MIHQVKLKWDESILAKFLKAHPRYKTSDGKHAPGVTTVGAMLDKSGPLMYWAWDLGMQKIDYRKERDRAANIGTVSHEMIKIHLIGQILKRSDRDIDDMIRILSKDYAPVVIGKAENCFVGFLDYQKQHKLVPTFVETQIVNDKFFFGGMLDFYGLVDGSLDLVDFKTGKRIYDSHVVQTAAYRKLLIEEGCEVKRTHILRLGKDDGDFDPHTIPNSDLDDGWKLFAGLLFGYPSHQSLKKKYSKSW